MVHILHRTLWIKSITQNFEFNRSIDKKLIKNNFLSIFESTLIIHKEINRLAKVHSSINFNETGSFNVPLNPPQPTKLLITLAADGITNESLKSEHREIVPFPMLFTEFGMVNEPLKRSLNVEVSVLICVTELGIIRDL